MLFDLSAAALALSLLSTAVSASPMPQNSATTDQGVVLDPCDSTQRIDGQVTYRYCCRDYDIPPGGANDGAWFGKDCKPLNDAISQDVDTLRAYCPYNDFKTKNLLDAIKQTLNPLPSRTCCLSSKVSSPQDDNQNGIDGHRCLATYD